MDEERRTPAIIPEGGDEHALRRLHIARQQKDLAVGKPWVRTRQPMYQLPPLAIGHHWCFAASEAASRQQLKSRNTDPAGPIASMGKEFHPARVGPVLRVLVRFHFCLFGASQGLAMQCGARMGGLVHQKMSSAPVCSFERTRRKLPGTRGEARSGEFRP